MLERARSGGWCWRWRSGSAMALLAVLACAAPAKAAPTAAAKDPMAVRPANTAASPARSARPGLAPKLAPDVLKRLASGNEDEMKSALDDVRLLGTAGAAAAPEIAAILDRGAHRELTVAALETLGDLHVAATGPSIAPYAGHRELGIRRAAVTALGETHGEGSLPVLRRALGDPNDDVRSAAARGLATKDAARYAMDLALAIDHKIIGAGYALGAACSESTCTELAGRFGRSDNADIASGLDVLFDRTDLPESVKLDVLTKLAASNDPAAHDYLVALRAKQPKKGAVGQKGAKNPKTAKDESAFSKALNAAVSGVAR